MSVAYSPTKSHLRSDLTNILELNSKRISPIKPYDLDKINFGKPLDTQPSRNQSKLYIMPMFQSKKQSSISTIRINNNRSQSLYKTNQMLSNNNATMWQDYYQSSKKIGVSQLTLEIQQLSAFEKQQAYNKLLLPKYGVKTLRNQSINFLNSSNIEQESTIKQSEKIGLFQMNNNESKLDHLKDIASTQQNKYRSLTNNIKRQAAQNEEKLLNNIKAMRSIISPTNKKYFQTPNNFNDNKILSESKHIGGYQNFKRDDQTPEITQILSPTYIENVFSMTTVKNQRRFSNKKAIRQDSIETMQMSRETILPDINNSLKQHSMKIQDDTIKNLLLRQSTNKNDLRSLFDSQHEVKIYKSGQQNINEKSKCVRFDLNQLKKQFFVYKGEEEIHESGKIIEIQSQFYEQALQELLEQCNETFLKQYDLKSSKPIIIYNFMFLPNGKQIKNILQIPEDQQYLICSKREKFHAIQFEEVTSLRQSKVIDMKNEIKQSINKLQRTIKNQLEDTNIVDQKNVDRTLDQGRIQIKSQKLKSKSLNRGTLNHFLKMNLPNLNSTLTQRFYDSNSVRQQLIDLNQSFNFHQTPKFGNTMIHGNDKIQNSFNNQEKNDESDKNNKGSSMLNQAFQKRKEWAERYQLTNKTLYELFSEFVSMIMLSKSQKSNFKNDDVINTVLEVPEGQKMSKYFKEKVLNSPVKLDMNKMEIPIEIMKKYSIIVRSQNKAMIDRFLHAFGLEVYNQTCAVTWESYIFINCLLKFYSASKDEYINFFIGVFDPYKLGTIKSLEFNTILEDLFRDQFSAGIEEDQNALANDIKRKLKQLGIVNEYGDLIIKKLKEGFQSSIIDIEIFKQALK